MLVFPKRAFWLGFFCRFFFVCFFFDGEEGILRCWRTSKLPGAAWRGAVPAMSATPGLHPLPFSAALLSSESEHHAQGSDASTGLARQSRGVAWGHQPCGATSQQAHLASWWVEAR